MNSVSLQAQEDAENNKKYDSIVMIIISMAVNILLSFFEAWSVPSTFICIFSFNPHNGAVRWVLLCPHFTGGKISTDLKLPVQGRTTGKW